MNILQDKGKRRLTLVVAPALAHGARRRIEEKSTVIGLPIVITSCAKAQRPAKNQERGRQLPPVMVLVNKRRIKWRKVWTPLVIFSFKCAQRRVNSERSEHQNDGNGLCPPGIASQSLAQSPSGSRSRPTFRHECVSFANALD